jgi:hypothetical protein
MTDRKGPVDERKEPLTLATAKAYAAAAFPVAEFPQIAHTDLVWRADDDGGFEACLYGCVEFAVWPCEPHHYGYDHGASLGFAGVYGEA